MPKRTVDTESVLATSKAFNKSSEEFKTSVTQLKTIIGNYISANDNEAAKSVEQEWNQAQQKMQDVVTYLNKFGDGLNAQAKSMDDAFNGLKWK